MAGKNVIVVDDGLKTYSIENKSGEVLGEFRFNPSDTNIIRRYEDVAKFLNEVDLSKYPEGVDGMTQLEDDMKKQILYLLNVGKNCDLFKVAGPMTPLVSGELYIENVMDAIKAVIEAETGERVKKARSRASKYTQKYHK